MVQVAISANGRTAVAWGTSAIGLSTVAYTTGRAATGAWAPRQFLSPGGLATIAINDHGALAAVWTVPDHGDFLAARIVASLSANGSTWSPQTALIRFDASELLTSENDILDGITASLLST